MIALWLVKLRIFYLSMKLGDICVIRNIYGGAAEYILGEVISGVIWKISDFHKIWHEGGLGIRLVHWHYTDSPYYKLALTPQKLVRYLSAQRTISRINIEYGKKELWDLARTHGIEATTNWYFEQYCARTSSRN